MAAALLLVNSLGIGGSERKSVRVANALRQAGKNIHVAYLNPPHTLREHLDPAVPTIHLDREGKFSLPALRRLKRYLVDQEISSVACMNLYPLLYAQPAAWQLGKHAPFVTAMINTSEFHTRREERQMLIYAPLLRRATHLVFGCRLQEERWLKRYGLPRARSRVIYNGVDLDYFNTAAVAQTREELRRSHALPQDAFVVITVGQLRPEKQHVHFIQAVAALVSRGLPIHALLVGEGEQRQSIEKCIGDLGLIDQVRLLGASDDVRPFLKLADAFVLTSTAVETFSNAALEAMAMALPVILSDIGGASEMVDSDHSGFLYPPGQIEMLTDRLAALATDAAFARRIGEAARKRAQERFGSARLLDDYRRLLFPS